MRPLIRDILISLPLLCLVGLVFVWVFHVDQENVKPVESPEYSDFEEIISTTEGPYHHVHNVETTTVAPIVIDRPTALLQSRRIPVEFDPMRKLACHQSGYTSDDCVSLATDFCGGFPGATMICDVSIDWDIRNWWLNKEGSLRFIINAYGDAITRGMTNELNGYRLAPYPADTVNLRDAPELEEEYNLVRHIYQVYALARHTTFKPIPLWSFYQEEEVVIQSVYRCISEHLKVRALLEACAAPEFASRVASNVDTRTICVDRQVPECTVSCWHRITDASDVRLYFWNRLKQYPAIWDEAAANWLALIPPEFNPGAAALAATNPSQEDSRAIAAEFADGVGIPSTYEVEATATFAYLDRLNRALPLLNLARTRELWPAAAAAVNATATPDELLNQARQNAAVARATKFWLIFFSASTEQQIVQGFADLHAALQAAPPVADDECAICNLNVLDETLRCGHRFHRRCLERWFQVRVNCPICRMRNPRG